jgi:hypothetical protein
MDGTYINIGKYTETEVERLLNDELRTIITTDVFIQKLPIEFVKRTLNKLPITMNQIIFASDWDDSRYSLDWQDIPKNIYNIMGWQWYLDINNNEFYTMVYRREINDDDLMNASPTYDELYEIMGRFPNRILKLHLVDLANTVKAVYLKGMQLSTKRFDIYSEQIEITEEFGPIITYTPKYGEINPIPLEITVKNGKICKNNLQYI